MRQTLLILLACILFCGCRTTKVTSDTYNVRTDTVYMNQVRVDSVLLHDSIFQKEYLQGDTVVVYKYVSKIKYRDRIVTDTCYVSKTDTVRVEVLKEVVKRPSIWSTLKAVGFGMVGGVLLLLIVCIIILKHKGFFLYS